MFNFRINEFRVCLWERESEELCRLLRHKELVTSHTNHAASQHGNPAIMETKCVSVIHSITSVS
jgi:hypothetical protein